ncbi:MAG: hypothetical protein HYS09_05995 [Chloroflexi bacterium]|nr:hypothetical protein [Chloroflexota bacterium]
MHPRLSLSLGLLAALVAVSAWGGVALMQREASGGAVARLADRYSYNVVRWEMRHFLGKVLYKVGHVFARGDSEADVNAIVERYFTVVRDIAALEQGRGPVGAETLAEKRAERAQLENRVEDILEGRITRLLEEQGLTISPPLFDGWSFVFPPVDFELDNPPRILAVSPRERIELDDTFLLRHGLDLPQVERLEDEVDAQGVSSLVVSVQGVATYPSVVPELSGYRPLVGTVIHEWVHHYLALHPLGRAFFDSRDTRTLNETVANIASSELAGLLFERYPSPEPAQAPPAASRFDFVSAMRALRRHVEELLADGRVVRAERLMEAKRRLFVSKGVYIRKINQAYFAFSGSYADSPASIDPIGPKLQALREKTGSVGEFVRVAARITSVEELDQALAGPLSSS